MTKDTPRKPQSPEHKTYYNMKQRCLNPNNPDYHHYGGRGVTICNRWLGVRGFANFTEDMGVRPKGMELDRKDNDKGYSPDNCRWTDRSTQTFNQRLSSKNKSGYRGVSKSSTCDRWQAQITVNGKQMYLGLRSSLDEAIKLRKAAEIKYGIGG